MYEIFAPSGDHRAHLSCAFEEFVRLRVGPFSIGAVNDPEGETLVLAELVRLTPEALAFARSEALRLEAHAYQVSDTYRQTSPMELPGSTPRSMASLHR